jgi:Cu(I)/Ag(I) efflux system membrane fusion protein
MVVVNGNFKIDSAIQIQAKPSMMNRQKIERDYTHHHGNRSKTGTRENDIPDKNLLVPDTGPFQQIPEFFTDQLAGLYNAYFKVQYALSHDDYEGAKKSNADLLDVLDRMDVHLLKGKLQKIWKDDAGQIKKSGILLKKSKDIKGAREGFVMLSDILTTVVRKYGTRADQPVYRYHCPMAFGGRGAYWLQNKQGTENPYYGSAMFKCGTEEETLNPAVKKELKAGKLNHE